MKRTLVALVATTTLLLTACGGGDEGSASDPAPVAGGGASGDDGTSAQSGGEEPELIGDYPAYPHADYTYELRVQCFCPYFGQPVTVTVVDGDVAEAVWSRNARDHVKGEPVAEEWLRLSIDDILREAADPSYDEVRVTWPEGADHPDQVAIDKMENAVDDEITYLLRDVRPA